MSINFISARQRGGRVARRQRGQVQGERGFGRHPLVGRPQTEDGQAGLIRPHRSQQVNHQKNIPLKRYSNFASFRLTQKLSEQF
jgi:hypothetical protein